MSMGVKFSGVENVAGPPHFIIGGRWKFTMPDKPLPENSAESTQTRHVTSEELFAGGEEVTIVHRGAPYRLRITRQDKLILTK